MLISVFAAIALLGLSYLFLTAGYQKLSSGEHWQTVVADYQVLPPSLVTPVVKVLPFVEISLAVALLVSPLREAAWPGLAALLSIYTFAMVVNLVRGRRDIDCGCAGPAQEQPLKGASINQDFFVSARKSRAQNRSVYGIHEDSSTGLTPQSRKKTINRGALKPGLVVRNLLLLSLTIWLWLYPHALPTQAAEWGLALVSSLVLFICLDARRLLLVNNNLLREIA